MVVVLGWGHPDGKTAALGQRDGNMQTASAGFEDLDSSDRTVSLGGGGAGIMTVG